MLDRAAALPPAELPTEAPAATIGRWRHDLDATRKAQCADAFSDVLEQFGYCV